MRKMWRIYSLAWLAYIILISAVLQITDAVHGEQNLVASIKTLASLLPAPFFLAMIWPLGDFLYRRKFSVGKAIAVHALAALLFATCSHVISYVFLFKVTKDFMWLVWPFLYSMMMYGVVASIFSAIRLNIRSREQAIQISQAQSLLVAAELSALRNKLNPHFLFNTLHSIIALVRKDALAAEAALFRFSDMLRYILDTEKSGSDRVLIDDELAFVRDYLDLEALRLGSRLHVQWDIDDAVGSASLPALTIQPLVENSIKHAFNPRSQPGILSIAAHLNVAENCIVIRVADDGPGADIQALKQSNGMGIATVERRMKLEYRESGKFQIHTEPGLGFAVTLQIPCKQH